MNKFAATAKFIGAAVLYAWTITLVLTHLLGLPIVISYAACFAAGLFNSHLPLLRTAGVEFRTTMGWFN